MNSAMTVGLHHGWRKRAADRAELGPGDQRLDLCCGTGDLAPSCASGSVPGVSSAPTSSACWFANDKAVDRGFLDIAFEWADALELPYSDASFDAVTVGFGVRNLADLDAGGRDGARPAARRAARDPRDHGLGGRRSRPSSSSGSTGWSCSSAGSRVIPRRTLPARVRAELPAAQGLAGDHGPRRVRAHPLHHPCRGDHRDPPGARGT